MFLSNPTASRNFQFAEVYSCLQKSIRRNDVPLCLELAKEFKEYPNALKKRLIYVTVEDVPDYRMVYEIYKTTSSIDELIKWIPIVCNHIKTRAGTDGFRYAVECPLTITAYDETYTVPLVATSDGNIKQMLITTAYLLKNHKEEDAIEWFEQWLQRNNFYKQYKRPSKVKTIYNFINKVRNVILGLCVYTTMPEIRTYKASEIKDVVLDVTSITYNEQTWKLNMDEFTLKKLPAYTYDKHVAGGNATYEFFFKNLILSPRIKMHRVEEYGIARYLESNEGANLALFTEGYSETSTIYRYEKWRNGKDIEDPEIDGTLEKTLQNMMP